MHGVLIRAFALLLITLVACEVQAQMPMASHASGSRMEIPAGAEAGASFDVDRATQAYLDLVSPLDRDRSAAYANGGYWMALADFIFALLVAWLLLASRVSARMRELTERVTRRRNMQVMMYVIQYILLTTLLTLPWRFYAGFVREHRFGLATQNLSEWFGEQAIQLSVALVLGSGALTVIYAVVRRWPRSWWQGATISATCLMIFGATISPVFVSPLFNDYRPLEQGLVRERILSLARANGVPATDVYWFDGSKQTKKISANVSGLLGTTRISLSDTLLNEASTEEIEAVMAHELGHYVLNHGWEFIVYISILIAVGFAFLSWSYDRVWRWSGRRWGIRDVTDPAGLPLASALLSIYFFAATPVLYAIVRTNELEADQFGLNASSQPDGFARAAVRLATFRKTEPSGWEEALFYHHPSGRTRVRAAMRWKKEHLTSR